MINDKVNSFSSFLESIKTTFASDDIDWVKFVYDHYATIMSTAEYVQLDKSEHYWEHYRLEDFLKDKNYDPNIGWIVLYINQLKSSMDFKDIESILIPSGDTLRSLRQSFMQYRAHINACRT